MTVVIDANAFAAVFDPENADHKEFSELKRWIESGGGFLVYGGAKYKREVAQGYRRQRLIRQLKDAGKAFEICDDVVDALQADIDVATRGTDCNDQHIIALLIASRCALLCSNDISSFGHVKNAALYPKRFPRVRVYTGRRNGSLIKGKADPDAITNKRA